MVLRLPDSWSNVFGLLQTDQFEETCSLAENFSKHNQIVTVVTQGYRFLCSPGGGTPLYKLYRYVADHRVGFLRRFGLKTGLIHFAHFGLESGMVFEGTTECMNVFIVSIPNE